MRPLTISKFKNSLVNDRWYNFVLMIVKMYISLIGSIKTRFSDTSLPQADENKDSNLVKVP